jgi:hypothetical protein
MAQAGTVFTPGTSNVRLNQFGSNSAYTQATQYRYPRVSSGISVGAHYYGRTFYALNSAGLQSRSVLGSCSMRVEWSGSVSWALNANFTSQNQVISGTPVAADGYRVYMDSATSGTCWVKITSSLYASSFLGWYSAPSFAGGSNQSGSAAYAWSGNTAVTNLYGVWA